MIRTRWCNIFVEKEPDSWWLFSDTLEGIQEKSIRAKALIRLLFSNGIVFFDIFLVLFSFWFSYLLAATFWPQKVTAGFGHQARMLWFMLPATPFVLSFYAIYDSYRFRPPRYILGRLVPGLFTLFVLSFFFYYIVTGNYPARPVFFCFMAVSLSVLSLFRFFMIKVLGVIHQKGIGLRSCLIAGTNSLALKCVRDIREHPFWGIEIKGLLSSKPDMVEKTVEGLKVIGSLANMERLAERSGARELVIPLSNEEKEEECLRLNEEFVEKWAKTGRVIRAVSEAKEKPLSGARMKMGENVALFYTSHFQLFSVPGRIRYKIWEWLGFHPWITEMHGLLWKATRRTGGMGDTK
ncbi:MAG: hypothetical protein KAV83_11895 [Desulfobacterales bacterium]|nr:hypothetical protein [Desulfobacterales bacterium]